MLYGKYTFICELKDDARLPACKGSTFRGVTKRILSTPLVQLIIIWVVIYLYGTGLAHGLCSSGLLLNSDFETGTTENWVGYSDGIVEFNAFSPGKDSSYSARFSISSEGSDVWVYQSGIILLPDTTYNLTFDAYSDSGQNLRIILSDDVNGNDNYGIDRVFDITNSWDNHRMEFTTPVSISSARLTFWLGDWDATRGDYFFDNICLRLTTDITCQDIDNDGYGSPGDTTCNLGAQNDCDDNDRFSYPGAPEICDNKDNDCDGNNDEACIDRTPPIVNNFTSSSAGSVIISWDISDTGSSHLDRIEIWRSPDTQPDPTPEPSKLSSSTSNPMYWEYNSEPVLLIGGSDLDNLFQWDGTVYPWPDGTTLTQHLDLIYSNGGNYIRNTMSSRSYEPSDDLDPLRYNELPYPFKMINGKYDLNQWNPIFWQKLESLLVEARERDIIVQIEVWDRYIECCNSNSNNNGWYYSPWNPNNNINYDWLDSALLSEGWISNYNRFHMAAAENDVLLLPYQQRYVEKIVDTVIDGNFYNVLFQIDNESGIGDFDLEPDPYWANYIRSYAASKGRDVYVTASRRFHNVTPYLTTNFQDWANPEIYNVILNPIFNFLDISQNNGNPGEPQYNNLVWYRNKMIENGVQRPINNVKAYYMNWPTGMGFSDRTEGNDAEAGSRMWRAVFGGAASFRFHRNSPTLGTISQNGLGLSDLGRTHIRSMSMFQDKIHLFSMLPSNELLAQREENEAYCLVETGRQVAVFFSGQGDHTVQLDVTSFGQNDFIFHWLDVDNSIWDPNPTTHQGPNVTLTAPDAGHWVAVLDWSDPFVRAEIVDLRQNLAAQSIDAHNGQVTDYPPDGDWWYGLRIYDQAGNCITEENKDCSTGATNNHPLRGPINISANFGCTGHFDQDGDVDGSDISLFIAKFNLGYCPSGNDCNGDYNSDGFVDDYDLGIFASYFGQVACQSP